MAATFVTHRKAEKDHLAAILGLGRYQARVEES